MLPSFINMLSWWQWALLAAVPPAIVALYFLKLRREPVEVPSTYLWHKSLEDLHVNSLWQRLRQSLLLFLQLLIILLVILAVLRPNWRTRQVTDNRLIFLIDNSGSMSATDVAPSRLEEAKQQVLALIDEMGSGSVAMVVSFSDRARVEQPFTDNRKQLRRSVAEIRATQKSTSLDEALRVASGLANPGRTSTDAGDVQVADPLPATIYIFSDGNFPDVSDFSLGNLKPVYVPIGKPRTANVAITAFSTRRRDDAGGQLQAFGRIDNFGSDDVTVETSLKLDGELIDAQRIEIDAGGSSGVVFDLGELETGMLELSAATADSLAIDDRAWAAINHPHPARVLLVTPGNEPLQMALATERAGEIAEVVVETPSILASKDYQQAATGGVYDVVIYDRCQPPPLNEGEPVVPPVANTLFIGALPPWQGWANDGLVDMPQIIDVDRAHPLMQFIDLGDVLIAKGTPLQVPPGGSVLVHSHVGPIVAIAPRDGFEDAVVGFEIVGEEGFNTNWPLRLSFPLFVLNNLQYLGGAHDPASLGSVRPGAPIHLRAPRPVDKIKVVTPAKRAYDVPVSGGNTFDFTHTDQVGGYEVTDDGERLMRFTVNLFDTAESSIATQPDESINIGFVEVEGRSGFETARRELWKLLLMAGLAILLIEWYIYNRRVYL